MRTVIGDIVKSKDQYILQQCNCLTVRGHGLSETLARAFPYADIYSERRPQGNRNLAIEDDRAKPGTVSICMDPQGNNPGIICLFGQ